MSRKFYNKTVLISGGSRGQGAAEARMFAAACAQVIVGDVQDVEGDALVVSIARAGGKAAYRKLDVVSEQDWRDAVSFAAAEFGALHVLINNAGVSLRGVDLAGTTRADWDRIIAVNLTGPFLGSRTAAPIMRDGGGGAIVNIGLDCRHQRPLRGRLQRGEMGQGGGDGIRALEHPRERCAS